MSQKFGVVPVKWIVQVVHIVPKFGCPEAVEKRKGKGYGYEEATLEVQNEFTVNKYYWGCQE